MTIRLFSHNGQLISLKDKFGLEIADLLEKKDLSFKEIQELTKKPKSSLSLKLVDMEKQGLIKSYSSPWDKRVKLYKLQAKLVGSAQKAIPEVFEKTMDKLEKCVDKPTDFLSIMFHSVWYLLDSFGVDPQPTLKVMGERVGQAVAKNIKSKQMDKIAEELVDFYQKTRLGFIKIENTKPLTLSQHDCYQCGDIKGYGRSLCSFDKGLFKTVFEKKTGKEITISEIECTTKGAKSCTYVIIHS